MNMNNIFDVNPHRPIICFSRYEPDWFIDCRDCDVDGSNIELFLDVIRINVACRQNIVSDIQSEPSDSERIGNWKMLNCRHELILRENWIIAGRFNVVIARNSQNCSCCPKSNLEMNFKEFHFPKHLSFALTFD